MLSKVSLFSNKVLLKRWGILFQVNFEFQLCFLVFQLKAKLVESLVASNTETHLAIKPEHRELTIIDEKKF